MVIPVVVVTAVFALASLHAAGSDRQRSAGVTPFYIPGDTVYLTCKHGAIYMNSSKVCSDQSNHAVYTGTGVQTAKLTLATDTNYTFQQWSASGASCLGSYPTCGSSSTSISPDWWDYCAPTAKCMGTLTLVTYGPQTITARIFGGANATITLSNGGGNLATLANGQSYTLQPLQTVSIQANVPSGYSFADWLTDDGTIGSQTSSFTDFQAGTSLAGLGNLSLLVSPTAGTDTTPGWSGLVASGTGITSVSATFTVPSVSYVSCSGCSAEETLPIWVGIGGVNGNGNLVEAGVIAHAIPNGASYYTVFAQDGSSVHFDLDDIAAGSTVVVTVSYSASSGVSSWTVACSGGGNCGTNLPYSGNATYTPDTTTADWVVQNNATLQGGVYDLPTFSGSVAMGSPALASSGLSGHTYVLPGELLATAASDYTLSVSSVSDSSFSVSE